MTNHSSTILTELTEISTNDNQTQKDNILEGRRMFVGAIGFIFSNSIFSNWRVNRPTVTDGFSKEEIQLLGVNLLGGKYRTLGPGVFEVKGWILSKGDVFVILDKYMECIRT